MAGNFSKLGLRGYGWAMKGGILRALLLVGLGCASPARAPAVRGSPVRGRLELASLGPTHDPPSTTEGPIDLSQTGAKASTKETADEPADDADSAPLAPSSPPHQRGGVTHIYPGPGLRSGHRLGTFTGQLNRAPKP